MMASYVNLIGRIEAQIRTFRIASMFRVIKQRHAATPLNAIPVASSFSLFSMSIHRNLPAVACAIIREPASGCGFAEKFYWSGDAPCFRT